MGDQTINQIEIVPCDAAKAKHGRTISACQLYLSFIICLATLLSGVGYIGHLGRQMVRIHSRTLCAVMEMRYEINDAHHQLNAFFVNRQTDSLSLFREHLNQAIWYIKAIQHGGTNDHDTYVANTNPLILKYASLVQKQLEEYRQSVIVQLDMVGGNSDFKQLGYKQNQCVAALLELTEKMEHDVKQIQHGDLIMLVYTIIAVIICIVVMAALFWFFLRTYISGKQEYEAKLLQSNKELSVVQERISRINHKLKKAIAEAKRLARESNKANKLKTEFLANISHELRTPMNAVVGFSEILIKEPLQEYQQDFAKHIRNSASTMLTLIDGILDLTTLEYGSVELKPQSIELESLCREMWSIYYLPAESKGLNFEVQRQENLPDKFIADPLRLRQCLVCLVDNALKYTENGFVVIQISVRKDFPKDWLRFEIQDSGIGIPTDQQEWIWEVFNRVDNKVNRQERGLGLSLPITVRLVKLMGGRIYMSSHPNCGTTFGFEIPLEMADTAIHQTPHINTV